MLSTPPATVLQIEIPEFLQESVAEFVTFLPRLLAALVILVIGWAIGVAAAGVVRRLTDSVQLDRMVLDTPLGRLMGGSRDAVTKTFGAFAKWFVISLAVLAAANVLAIDLLSEWVGTAVSYLPAFIAGLVVIVLGFVVADFIGDAITRTRAATETPYTSAFAVGTRMFLYFTAVVIGLSTMGIDVAILFTIAQAFAWGIAAALAIGVGGAVAFGARDYVSANVERWMGSARSVAATPVSPVGGDTDTPEGASAADD